MTGAHRMQLQLEGLSFSYGEEGAPYAISQIDASFSAGEIVCLCGPNGSGKSTLLKLAGGVLEPSAGTVRVDGVVLSQLDMGARAKRIASVPQRLEALPETTVESFVLGGRYAHTSFLDRALGAVSAKDHARIEEALRDTDALPWRKRLLVELSGGERQRVLVARALAQKAPLLLFDEPTAMLDPAHQIQVFRLIAAAREQGRTALVATHDLNLAGRYADRLLILEGGRIAASGRPHEVLRPEVLHPVYGPDLWIEDAGGRILVYPWPTDELPGTRA